MDVRYSAFDSNASEEVQSGGGKPSSPANTAGQEERVSSFMAVHKEHAKALEGVESARIALARQAATALTAIPAISGDRAPPVFRGSGMEPGLEMWKLMVRLRRGSLNLWLQRKSCLLQICLLK